MGEIGIYAEQSHGYYTFPKLEGEIKPHMMFMGKERLVWSLNNYLGLANHPEVRKADAEAAAQYGMAYPMGARMMSGQTKYHEQLENELAAFVKREAAFLLNYGYQGMLSIIDSLVDRKDVIVYDSEAHACIIDGMRLHIGKRFVYPHNNIENLKKQLSRAKKITNETGGGILVITEGVYGMSGDLGKLKDIVELKKDFNFRLLVDDAHGFGTMGPSGAGTDEHFGVQEGVDVYFGTFAKAMAGIGGFVASKKRSNSLFDVQHAFANLCQIIAYANDPWRPETPGNASRQPGTQKQFMENCKCVTRRFKSKRIKHWQYRITRYPR